MLTRKLIRDKNSNPDKESHVINIQTEINRHPDDSLNIKNSTQNSSSIIVTSPPTNQHHAEYQNQSRNDFISNHQTESVISNPLISIDSQTEKMPPDLPILTKQHSSNGIRKDWPRKKWPRE